MASEITGSVQAMESEAARVMEEARTRAADILQQSREETKKMAGARLPLDDVRTECAKIVEEATKKAATNTKQAEALAAEIKAKATGKAGDYAKSMVNIVLGEKTG